LKRLHLRRCLASAAVLVDRPEEAMDIRPGDPIAFPPFSEVMP